MEIINNLQLHILYLKKHVTLVLNIHQIIKSHFSILVLKEIINQLYQNGLLILLMMYVITELMLLILQLYKLLGIVHLHNQNLLKVQKD